MGKPEAKVENYLKTLANKTGFLYWKFTTQSQTGVPDRILIGHGYTFFVELKQPGEKPRKDQKAVIELMRDYGAIVYVGSSKEECDAIVKDIFLRWRPQTLKKPRKEKTKP